MADKDFLTKLSKELNGQGKLIEAGWLGLRVACDLEDAPAIQLEEMRNAFFAGAQHLFSSILTIMDEDREPTPADLLMMDHIQRELDGFIADFAKRRVPTTGGLQ
jgi:hypothetical protein